MDNLLFQVEEKLGILTINRPEALNALNQKTLKELSSLLDNILPLYPEKIRALVITGSGMKSFVAGADIKEMLNMNQPQALEFSELGQKCFSQLEALPFPVVAAVNGFAFGGGLELALACDWIYASDQAVFALPEVQLSLIPGFGGTARLVEKIGLNKSMELILTGARIKAQEAYHWGLVNQVLPGESLLETTKKSLSPVVNLGPRAVGQAKRVIQRGRREWLQMALQDEAESFSDLFNLEDVKEGLNAFTQKRKPEFKGV